MAFKLKDVGAGRFPWHRFLSGRFPWRWDPGRFHRWGPFSMDHRLNRRQYHRHRSGYPRAHWMANPTKIVKVEGRAVLLDSWVMLALRRGVPAAAAIANAAGQRTISAITYIDMLAAATGLSEGFLVQKFLKQQEIDIVPITQGISRRAALYAEYYGHMYGLSPRSALIAATAYEEGLVLVSRSSDFRELPELELVPFPT